MAAAGEVGGEAHAVGMVRQPLALVEAQVRASSKAISRAPASGSRPVSRIAATMTSACVRIDPVGALAGQAEQDGAVGRMALAGQRQRPVEIDLDPLGRLEQALVAQPLDKSAGGGHRSHRV